MFNKMYFGILVGEIPLDNRLNMRENEPSFAYLPTYSLIKRRGCVYVVMILHCHPHNN